MLKNYLISLLRLNGLGCELQSRCEASVPRWPKTQSVLYKKNIIIMTNLKSLINQWLQAQFLHCIHWIQIMTGDVVVQYGLSEIKLKSKILFNYLGLYNFSKDSYIPGRVLKNFFGWTAAREPSFFLISDVQSVILFKISFLKPHELIFFFF